MKKLVVGMGVILGFIQTCLAQAVLPTVWNFSNPSIANPPSGWTLGLGTNGNLTYSFGIGDAIAARLDATGEFIAIQIADKPGELSYYLRGTGFGANPPFSGSFKIQESANGQIWTDARTISSLTGAFVRYQELLQSNTRFIRFYYQEKQDGSNVALDSVMIKQAPAPPTPGILIKKGLSTLVNGSTVVIGNIASTQFNLQNTGTQQTLKIDSAIISGMNASDFSLLNFPDSLTATSNTNFTIGFIAGSPGTRMARLTVYSNDPDKSVFSLNLYGVGGNFATEPLANANGISFSAIKSFGFMLNLDAPNKVAEKYLILRKLGAPVSEIPVDGVTYKKGNYIGSSQVEVITDSSLAITPNYILALQNYHYAVFSYNGPAGYENYNTVSIVRGNVNTTGKTPGNYYSGINPASTNFVSALSAKINPHDTIYYSNYIPRMVNPWLARDTTDGKKVVTCVYTGHQFVHSDPFQWANGTNGAVLTREHTWPQSWMPTNQGNPDWPNAPGTNRELPEFNDLHNLFPAHQINANARRSNNPFHEVVTPTYTSPTGFGMLGQDSFGITSYEPRPEQKGDLARALFYMAVAYNGISSKSWAIPNQQSLTILKQWHQMDPPDAYEIARNEFIAVTQKNRNPFIDFPEWVERINFRSMTYVPADSIPPMPKGITITSPTASSNWKKGVQATISFTYQNVDSVLFLFSTDSMKTWINLLTGDIASPVSNNPFAFTPANYFTKPYGVLIIKDKFSSVADTSDYFGLEMANGLSEGFGLNQVLIYPNPASDFIEVEANGVDIKNVSILDLQGREILSTENRKINLKEINAGVYLIKVSSAAGFVVKRFQKF